MFRSLLLVLCLVACENGASLDGDGKPGDSAGGGDSGEPRALDADRDGYDAQEDCDEADPAINPGATERCDGVDQDCDGAIDDDVRATWYTDADGDGYGDAGAPIEDCDPGAGFVADDTDCDDASASVSPGADEVCNGADDDCDGLADEDAVDPGTWYTDADGDGYGDPETATVTCEPGPDSVSTGGDCADDDAEIHPEAAERCDEVDQDCDGTADDNPADPSTWYADYDGDGFGDPGVETWDCTAPSGYVANATDCDDGEGTVNPDGSEVCDGVDQDCDGIVDDDASDMALYYEDADGDGYGDADAWSWACDVPAGYTEDDSDCDDGDDAVYPGAAETCDDVDEDCDGAIDESATDLSAWYRDSDRDGYGDATVVERACDMPAGYVAAGTDCADDDREIHPAASEDCDGEDQNCDDVIDDDADCPCDMDWYGDNAYLFCDTKEKWTDAQEACDDLGYHLLTIDDSAENTWSVDTAISVSTSSYWWFGYNDRSREDTWVWEDGSSATYTNWASGEPNDSGGEDCAQLYRFSDYTWNDSKCDSKYYYVCESY